MPTYLKTCDASSSLRDATRRATACSRLRISPPKVPKDSAESSPAFRCRGKPSGVKPKSPAPRGLWSMRERDALRRGFSRVESLCFLPFVEHVADASLSRAIGIRWPDVRLRRKSCYV